MPATDQFVYLESLQELADWRPESAAAIHISNTPLAPRPTPPPAAPDNKIANLVLCHDFLGSYHATEAAQGYLPLPESAQRAVYTAEYLQFTTTFIYFSHKRIAIPPVAWINACHRAGIKVLGTFVLEDAEALPEAGRLFEKGSEGEYLFATQLVRIKETYGFDGWLLNIETVFPPPFRPSELQAWIGELKAASVEVLWYDAVTVLNQLHWQNGLTLLNAPFMHASDGLFTNYWWREPSIRATKRMADAMGRARDVWMGVDCYGRGTIGDGGFAVPVALEVVRSHGLPAALFAPGWTYENFDGKHFHQMDRKFWIGDGTPQAVGVAAHVSSKPSGTAAFFYTSFNRGFGSGFWLRGKKITDANWVHIGAQSLLPNQPTEGWSYEPNKVYTGGWSLKLAFPTSSSSSTATKYTPLYSVGIKHAPNLVMQYVFQTQAPPSSAAGAVGLYWEFRDPKSGGKVRRMEAFEAGSTAAGRWQSSRVLLGDEDVCGFTITEVGVYHHCNTPKVSAPAPRGGGETGDEDGEDQEVWLGELMITTLDGDGNDDDDDDRRHGDEPPTKITSVVFHPATDGEKAKITWNLYPSIASDAVVTKRAKAGMWSEQTKDYAYFIVFKDSKWMGLAHASEYLVLEDGRSGGDGGGDLGKGWRVTGVTWEGVAFESDKPRSV